MAVEPVDSMVEVVALRDEVEGRPDHDREMPCKVRIEFANGLRLERDTINLDSLLEMLNKIRPVLCLS